MCFPARSFNGQGPARSLSWSAAANLCVARGGGAVAGADRFDRAQLPQIKQEGRPASLSTGQDAVDPPVAAVVFTQRSSDWILDETTILSFRYLLEKYGLGEQIFDTVKAHLSERGMTMR